MNKAVFSAIFFFSVSFSCVQGLLVFLQKISSISLCVWTALSLFANITFDSKLRLKTKLRIGFYVLTTFKTFHICFLTYLFIYKISYWFCLFVFYFKTRRYLNTLSFYSLLSICFRLYKISFIFTLISFTFLIAKQYTLFVDISDSKSPSYLFMSFYN